VGHGDGPAPPSGWRRRFKVGDVLRTQRHYETQRASWYWSMGIMSSGCVQRQDRRDPFTQKLDRAGAVTHEHLPENNDTAGSSTSRQTQKVQGLQGQQAIAGLT